MSRALLLSLLLASPAWGDPPDGGANVSVIVEPDGATTVDVKRGTVAVKSGGSETRVGAGEAVRAQKGKPLKRLLAAPAAVAPADQAALNASEVAFSWRRVPHAARYLLEISASPEMAAARTQTVDGPRALVRLDSGTYYWRVVALDGGGSPGKRTVARRLTIETTPPKLKVGKPEWK